MLERPTTARRDRPRFALRSLALRSFALRSLALPRAILALTTLALAVHPALAAEPAEDLEDSSKFVRVASEGDSWVALEIASRRYVRKDAAGPQVDLVGVVHIGDLAYFRGLQRMLAEYDVVLYESVKPSGTGGAGGETDEQRIASTRSALDFVGGVIEHHNDKRDRYPESLDAVRVFAGEQDPRLAKFVESALVDAWGERFDYTVDHEAEPPTYRLVSLGADGRPGGVDADADIRLVDPSPAAALRRSREDNLQVQLAEAMALSFQLDAIDYADPSWRCSDMSLDQVQRAMSERGADFTLVEGTLAGTSFPAKLARFLLGVVRMADLFTGGAVSDMLKVVLIEMLGDERMIQEALRQFDDGFTEVIIGDRNQVVVNDLAQIIRDEPDIEKIAILYGAGHMADLTERMRDQLDYTSSAGRAVRWHRAIEVDLTTSAVSPDEVRQLRLMIRRTMRQMTR